MATTRSGEAGAGAVGMPRRVRRGGVSGARLPLAGLALAIIALTTLLLDAAVAQGRIAGTYGDWQIRCNEPLGAPSEQCALVQNVAAQDRANVSLTVLFLWTADRQSRLLRVMAPLGVLLKPGMGLSIDGNEVGRAGFVRCRIEGCLIEVVLDDGLMERFDAGQAATFVIFQTPEAGIGIPISLDGFSEGFAALEDPPEASAPGPAEEVAPAATVLTETVAADGEAEAGGVLRSAAVEADERTAIDRLLEDPLLPVVAGGVVGALLVLALLIILVRRMGRGGRRTQAVRGPARVPPRIAARDADDDEPRARRRRRDSEEEELQGPRRPRPAIADRRDDDDDYDDDDDDHDDDDEAFEEDDRDERNQTERVRRRAR